MLTITAIAAGGAVGAVLRYTIALATAGAFPYGTLLVNIAGAGLLGVAYAYAQHIPPAFEAGIRVGLLGALTTFSTFAMDSVLLFEQGRMLASVAYISVSVLCSLAAFAAFYGWLR